MLPVLTLPGSLPEILSVLPPCFTSQQYPDHARTTPTAVTTSTTTAITPTRAVLVIRGSLVRHIAIPPTRSGSHHPGQPSSRGGPLVCI